MDYQFKLEALRRYRTYQEEFRQKEMADAQRLRDHEKSALDVLIALREKTEKDLRALQTKQTTGPHLSIYGNYLDKIASDIFAQKFKLAEAQKKFEQKHAALLVAVQKRKTLEKLKQKGLKAYFEKLNSEEAKFINEMAINRFTMKQR